MTQINTEYSTPIIERQMLCHLKTNSFFRLEGELSVYRFVGYCSSTSSHVLSLDDLEVHTMNSLTKVEPIDVNEIVIKVDINE